MLQLEPEQWAEVRRLFGEACELPPEEWERFLVVESNSEAVRQEVLSLLGHSLTGDIAEEAPADPDQRLLGRRLGPYRIESIVGHGGMGAVYRACRDDGEFQQVVAIKLVRAAESTETLQRFRQERQILARLAHPNIARLLDGGSTDEGVPYLVMEFIEGAAINAWCDSRKLPMGDRLRLFLDVCDAVGFAHSHAVVHRDLKPGNILVTAAGVPKLLDFGIAKMLTAEGAKTDSTVAGTRLMTPEYAAPEQVLGERVTAATDVYALGLCLYELLTGKRAQEIPQLSPATVARVVCQAVPAPPAKIRPELAGDLDNIVRMALRKEPERRYATVDELAGDIRRHLAGRPVAARPDTIKYRAGKFLRRNRTATAAALGTAAMLAAIAVVYQFSSPAPPRVLRVNQLTQSGHVVLAGDIVADDSYAYFVEGNAAQKLVARIPVEGGAKQILSGPYDNISVDDVSRDGSRLLMNPWSYLTGISSILEAPARGGSAHQVGNVEASGARFSPGGRSILFWRDKSLFEMLPDGTGSRRILDAPGRLSGVRHSPTARQPIFRFSLRDENVHRATLWEANGDGGKAHRLFPDWGKSEEGIRSNDDGRWGYQGRYYFFRSSLGSDYSIWATRSGPWWLGGRESKPMLVYSAPTRIGAVAPSRNQKRVFFLADQERRELARYDTGKGEFRPYLPGLSAHYVSYSKDGNWIAYTSAPADALWRSRPDGSAAVRLTPPGTHAYGPDWSPDGSVIVFEGFLPGEGPRALAISAAGGVLEKLGDSQKEFNFPRFSPDGTRVLMCTQMTGHGSTLAILDWKTKTLTPLDETLVNAALWISDRRIAGFDSRQAMQFDFSNRRWSVLAQTGWAQKAILSTDGNSIYYQIQAKQGQPIVRISTRNGKELGRLNDKQIPQSDVSQYDLVGMDPSGAPIVSLLRRNADVYSLDLDLP